MEYFIILNWHLLNGWSEYMLLLTALCDVFLSPWKDEQKEGDVVSLEKKYPSAFRHINFRIEMRSELPCCFTYRMFSLFSVIFTGEIQ
jgi:hypothetical protein